MMQFEFKKIRRSLLKTMLGGLALAFAVSPVYAEKLSKVRIGVATAGGGEPITWGGSPGSVARLNSWIEEAFKDDGVDVEWVFFKGAGPAVNEALSNKQIDFAYHGDLPSVVGRANGLKTRVLLISGPVAARLMSLMWLSSRTRIWPYAILH